MEHTSYPHRPGTLHDCEACEDECFCADNPLWRCVWCQTMIATAHIVELENDCGL